MLSNGGAVVLISIDEIHNLIVTVIKDNIKYDYKK